MFRNTAMSMRLPIAVFLLIVVASIAIVYTSYSSISRLVIEQEKRNQSLQAELVQTRLAKLEGQIHNSLAVVSEQIGQTGAVNLAVVEQLQNSDPLFSGLAVISHDGQVIAAVGEASRLRASDFSNSAEVDGHIRFVRTLSSESTPLLLLVAPHLSGSIVVPLDPAVFQSALLTETFDHATAELGIFDRSGKPIVSGARFGNQPEKSTSFLKSMNNQASSSVMNFPDGLPYLATSLDVGFFGSKMQIVLSTSYDAVMHERNNYVKTLLAIVEFSALIFMLVVTLFVRSSVEPLKHLQAQLNEIVTKHDLTLSLHSTGNDEVGKSTKSVGVILDEFKSFVRDAKEGADGLKNLSREMSDVVSNLARESEMRAQSVQELSSMLAQSDAQMALSATAASGADQDMKAAERSALDGKEKINELSSAMKDVTSTSNDLSAVIKVIEDIAFQTNLLALNASVEAARAGLHGKGFAVVASEVGNLAKRSAVSAQESAVLVSKTLDSIRNSDEATQKAKTAFSEISRQVSQASAKVSDISLANQEQKNGLASASDGASSLAVSATNDAIQYDRLVKASEKLNARSEEISEKVGRYKYGALSGPGADAGKNIIDLGISLKGSEAKSAAHEQQAGQYSYKTGKSA